MTNEELQAKKEQMWDLVDQYNQNKRGWTWDKQVDFRKGINGLLEEINKELESRGQGTMQWETGHSPAN